MLGIVLSRRDFREHDQIISLLTREQGKIEALARGIKKSISKNSSALEPFAVVEAEIVPGKEIMHLITAQVVESFFSMRLDLHKSVYGSYILSLVDTMLAGSVREVALFELVRGTLAAIDTAKQVSTSIVPAFVINFWSLLGFRPVLHECTVCTEVCGDEDLVFDIAGGGVVHARCAKPSERTVYVPFTNRMATQCANLLNGTWGAEISPETHQLIYKFSAYHSEKKVPDWRAVDKLLA